MKPNLLVPVGALVFGIALGITLDRTVVGGSPADSPGRHGPGPGAASGRADERGTGSGRSLHRDQRRDPRATIRRLCRQFEMSPMINMDFEAMLAAYESVRWMGPAEIRSALVELDEQNGGNQAAMMLRFMLMGLWAKADGRGAMEYSLELTQPRDRMMSVMSSMMGWMKHDAHTAYDWFQNHRDELKGGFMGGMQMEGMFIAGLAQQDMDVAFSELGKLSGNHRDTAMSMVAGQVAADDATRERFIRRLQEVEDESLRRSGMRSLVSSWAMSDPEAVAEFLEGMDPLDEGHAEMAEALTSSWTMMDPEAAIEWRLKRVGEDEVAGDRIANSFGSWAAQDEKAASAWLARQPPDFATDELYSQAATQSTWSDGPEAATRWALKISDGQRRLDTLETIHSTLKFQDRARAEKWLEGLEPSVRAEVEALEPAEPAEILEP